MLHIGEQGTRITRKNHVQIFLWGGTEVIHALCVCACVYMYMHACGNAWVGECICMQKKMYVLCVSHTWFHAYAWLIYVYNVCMCAYILVYVCIYVYCV